MYGGKMAELLTEPRCSEDRASISSHDVTDERELNLGQCDG